MKELTDAIKKCAADYLNRTSNSEEYKNRIIDYFKTLKYRNMTQARKDTGLSYLGSVNSSAKIVKGGKQGYDTYILYLSPEKMSGYNTCSMASDGCKAACLNTSGRVIMDTKNTIQISRLLKTWLFYANRDYFVSWLMAEINSADLSAHRKGHKFAVRLNGTSDLSWKLFKLSTWKDSYDPKNIVDYFYHIQFYDYTKLINRLERDIPRNMHLTFSHSGINDIEVSKALTLGFNVAVPFAEKLPHSYKNTIVIDGDETDLRFLDKSNVIVGLKVKRVRGGKKALQTAIDNNFVIQA
jgi:hypothetical protein